MYALQDITGKGKGLIATQKIPQGTRILCEEPIIKIPNSHDQLARHSKDLDNSICQQVNTLTKKQRQAFLALHNIYPYTKPAEQYIGIIRTNGLPIEDGKTGGGIFLEASRINHACDNNAQKSWNKNIKRHTVHALRDIAEGEEITIYYLAVHGSRETRREALQARFHFKCFCRLCSLSANQSQKNDEILEEISRLDSLVGQGDLEGILSLPLQTLRYLDREIELYNMTGPDDPGVSRVYLDAAQVAIAHGDLARGRVFAERAVRGWRISEGSDSKKVLEYEALSQNPSQLPLHGLSDQWKTAVDDFPSALESDSAEFDEWLWKREKLKLPYSPSSRMVNIRDCIIFPAFRGLPAERPLWLDLDPYEDSGQPRQHWCFVAEIVDFNYLTRLHMKIRDVEGRELPLFFYTEGRGSELGSVDIQNGYTVAILHARQHAFMFDEPGIRLEDPGRIKAAEASKNHIQPACKPYAIRSIPGKGKGLVATERIAKGTRILSESPIFRVPRDKPSIKALEGIVKNEVNRLTAKQQAVFFDLTNIYGDAHSHALGIARTNVLPLVGAAKSSSGLFLDASRINHSCRHNAQNTWNENIGQVTIHALRDINAGTEITISYLDSTPAFEERQHQLRKTFQFECKCELCSLPPAERKISDERLTKIHIIDSMIGGTVWDGTDPAATLGLLRMMLDFFEEEGIWDARVARAYNDAFKIPLESNDADRARVFATRAYEAWRVVEGGDSPTTMKMKRAADQLSEQVPEGMDKMEFED
ncbi:hypothetical protein BDV12DRAFT_204871 [Aspergillus spectabilis]